MLVTERLFIVHYNTWHSEETCEDSPFWGLSAAVLASIQRDKSKVEGKLLGG